MLCVPTVRTLKPGTFEEFREAFSPNGDPRKMSAHWVRFNMIRSTGNPDEVVCFGFYNGTVNELRRDADQSGYEDQLEAIAPFVESAGTDGLFEIIEDIDSTSSQSR